MEKKRVMYDASKGVVPFMNRVLLYPLDHSDHIRVSNQKQAMTSDVVSWDEGTGIIETQNSVYHPLTQNSATTEN